MTFIRPGSFLAVLALSAICGEAQVVITSNLLTNPGAETGTLGPWTILGGPPNTRPSVDNGTYDPGINPHSGTYQFVGDTYPGGGGPQGFLYQTVNVSAWASYLDTGGAQAKVNFWEQSYYQGTSSDYANVQIKFWNASSNSISTVTTPNIESVFAWTNFDASYTIPTGTRYITYTMEFYRNNNGGTYIDSFFDDNSLKLAVPEPATFGVVSATAVACGAGYWNVRRRSRGQGIGLKV